MNLARFGLTKNDKGEIVEDGSEELVEVEAGPGTSALSLVSSSEYLHSILGVSFGEPSLTRGRLSSGGRRSSSRRSPAKTKKKYLKRKKNTSKKFIEKMKKKFRLLDLKRPIREMKKDELLEHFEEVGKRGPLGRVDKKKFALNVIWQIHQEMAAGRTPEFAKVSCNIRSIYYYMKAVIRDNTRIFEDPDNIYDTFPRAMKKMVLAGLVSYKDFNIVDDRRSYRSMPPAYGNTNIILLAEKDSFVGRFFQLGSQYGVVVQITKGLSSILMTDTMLTEMYEAGYDMTKQLSILSFCDFDPVGTSIPVHFVRHLKALGFHNIREFEQYGSKSITRIERRKKKVVSQVRPCLDIVNPHDLEAQVRKELRHSMPAKIRDNPSTADWAFITGGVTGSGRNKEYAISSEMLLGYVADHLEEKITPLLEKPPEAFSRRLYYSYLKTAIREYIGVRAERGLFDGV